MIESKKIMFFKHGRISINIAEGSPNVEIGVITGGASAYIHISAEEFCGFYQFIKDVSFDLFHNSQEKGLDDA